jgi:hypothetical protein
MHSSDCRFLAILALFFALAPLSLLKFNLARFGEGQAAPCHSPTSRSSTLIAMMQPAHLREPSVSPSFLQKPPPPSGADSRRYRALRCHHQGRRPSA